MRKAIVASVAVGAFLMAGCSGGDSSAPEPAPPQEPTTSVEEAPVRAGPAKSVNLADRCAAITEAQWRALGADQPPSERDAGEGIVGCDYQLGSGAGDWTVFVSTIPEPLDAVAEKTSLRNPVELQGYPGLQRESAKNCTNALNVSDGGTLLVQSQSLERVADPCQLSMSFLEAALKNLPDAPGGQ